MNQEAFARQAQTLSQHIEALEQRALAASAVPPDLFFEALNDLRAALEVLRATEVELCAQNEGRAQLEQKLVAEQRRYHELFEFAPAGYLVTDANLIITEANQAAAALLNGTPQYLVGLPLPILAAQDSQQAFRHKLTKLRGTEQVKEWEVRLQPHKRRPFTAALSATAIHDADGRLTDWCWLMRDLSEQKRGEASLRQIIEVAPIGIILANQQGSILLVNAQIERLFGYARSELIGQPIELLVPERFCGEHAEHRAGFAAAPNVRLMGASRDLYGLRKDGSEIPVEIGLSPVEADGETLVLGSIVDITERQQAEKKIREQAILLDQTLDAIFLRTVEGRILYWNKGAERVFGYSAAEAVGHNVQDLIYRHAPDMLEQANDNLLRSESETWLDEARPLTKDGRTLVVERRWTLLRDRTGQPQSVLVTMTDITEIKQLEEQYLRTQRLDSIGALAGGLAHDLNNIFSPLLIAANLLKKECNDENAVRHLNLVINNVKRGCSMVKHVLSFVRGAEGRSLWFQPKHVIEEVLNMLEGIMPKEIELKKHIPANLWLIYGDSTKLHQGLVNLCVNARDAMPEGGLLQIRAENLELDATYAQMAPEATPGRYVHLSLIDTGIGMSPEITQKIFDPFFTSKEGGQGTGLGLATLKTIMSDFHGFLTVTSNPGEGTEFSLFFPATSATENRPVEEPEREPLAGQGELVLIASREASLREIIAETLTTYGYRILLADDGAEVAALLAQQQDRVQIVLTDLTLPTLSGAALIRAIRRIAPRAKIITQIDADVSPEQHPPSQAEWLGDQRLYKPYTAHQLLTTLAGLLKPEDSGH